MVPSILVDVSAEVMTSQGHEEVEPPELPAGEEWREHYRSYLYNQGAANQNGRRSRQVSESHSEPENAVEPYRQILSLSTEPMARIHPPNGMPPLSPCHQDPQRWLIFV